VKRSRLSTDAKGTIGTFAAGAGCGFLGGAMLTVMLLSPAGDPRPAVDRRGNPPSTLERWIDGEDDARRRPDETAVATAGTSGGANPPPPSPEPTMSAPAEAELGDRELLIPVEGVGEDQLTSSFHDERGGGRQHEAIDILAPRNTPVRAVESGTIARLFQSKAGGITIYQFDPSERFCYYYAHLERYADGLQEGQQVSRGQIIGYVGVSGNAPKDTPHLHFAIFRLTPAKRWWEGTPVDPFEVLR
jgi:murein DD-endopeptidase MepM/ murein hydrolase activator NlpD